MNIIIECVDAGVVSYERALQWQRSLREKRRRGRIANHLLLLEHPPVITFGKRRPTDDLRVDAAWIRGRGIEIHQTERGGRATYHGPGQLVGYLIFVLKDPIPKFVWKIEETLLRLLRHFHLEGERDKDHPGIWMEKRKIAALGLHIQKGITMHGFALNVNCDLRPFGYIHPCGIRDREVTSMEKELGWSPSLRDVKHRLLQELAAVFGMNISAEGTFPTPSE